MMDLAFAVVLGLSPLSAGAVPEPAPAVEMQARRLTPIQARGECWREAGFNPRAERTHRNFPPSMQPQIEACVRRKLRR